MTSDFSEQLRARVPAVGGRVFARRSSESPPVGLLTSVDAMIEEVGRFVGFLLAALIVRRSSLLVDYVEWARNTREARRLPMTDLQAILEELRADVAEIQASEVEFALTTLDLAARRVSSVGWSAPAPQEWDHSATASLSRKYLDLLVESRRGEAINLIMKSLDSGMTLEELYLDVLQPAMREVGRRWQANEISVAQEHYVSAVTQLLVSQLYPRLLTGPRNGKTLIATCVGSNLHEIGLRFLCDIFELHGWDTHFYGANTPPDDVIDLARRRRPDVVAVGVTLGSQLPAAAAFIRAMKRVPEIAQIPILVGGSAFAGDDRLWREIGADGHAKDALDAVRLANALTGAVR